jgi:8-oxo-dGTP diphosphatase
VNWDRGRVTHARATALISAPIELVLDGTRRLLGSDGVRVTAADRARTVTAVREQRRGALAWLVRLVETGAGTLVTAELRWRPARRSALAALVWGAVTRRALRRTAVNLVERLRTTAEQPPAVVVGAALLDGQGRVLAAERASPPALAGWWEFPGGKVEPGEDERAALVRECREELGVDVEPDGRLGADLTTAGGSVLRVWTARIRSGEPAPHEHGALRWLAADQLDEVPWLPADLPLVELLRARLAGGGPGASAG